MLTWSRTLIGGSAAPYDFTASDGDVSVGRIYRHDHGPQGGHWFWTMNAFGPGIDRSLSPCSGTAGSKDEAAALVEEAWLTCRLDTPTE